jgi:hypothetical protein
MARSKAVVSWATPAEPGGSWLIFTITVSVSGLISMNWHWRPCA